MITHRSGIWPTLLVLGGSTAILLFIAILAVAPGRSDAGRAGAQAPAAQVASNPEVDQPAMPALPSRVTSQRDVRDVVAATRAATERDIPALRDAALTSRDVAVASNAIRALGRLHAFGATPELLALLRDDRPRVREEAVVALGTSGDPAAVDDLAPLLQDTDQTVRSLAVRSLGQLGGPRATSAIERVLGDPSATAVDRAFARAAMARGDRRSVVSGAGKVPAH